MALENAIFTVLPNGVHDDSPDLLRATVFTSWRMTTDGLGERPLTDYPLFREWPRVIRDLELLVEWDTGERVPVRPDPTAARPDQDVFDRVFTDEVFVVDHEFRDVSERTWHSYPAADVASAVLGAYTAVGQSSPEALPPVTTGPLAEVVAQLGGVGSAPDAEKKRLDALRDAEQSQVVEGHRGRFVPPSQYTSDLVVFTALNRFYDRWRGGTRIKDELGAEGASVAPPPSPPRIDLHGYLAALGDYPALLRLLGLAFDVVLERAPHAKADGRVRLEVANPAEAFMTTEASRPWTNYRLEEPLFVPRPRSRRYLWDGQLNFHTERLFVHQVDIDGSGLKLVHAASSMDAIRRYLVTEAPAGSMTEDEGSLPGLRTAGFTVVHRHRVEAVVEQADHASVAQGDVAADTAADLFAEDLYRGYRLDVDDGNGYRSQCERVGRYAARQPDGTEVALDVPPDEGYVKAASTTSVPDDPDLYLHEAMASWNGWSMVTARPGHTLTTDEELDTSGTPPEPSPDVPLVTAFRPAPASLTQLRFGRRYQLRGRCVDLAGNSVRDKAIDPRLAADPQEFVRWEPVPHPVVLPHRAYGEGESQLRLVIRSTLGMTTAQYTSLPRITSLPAHSAAGTEYLVDDSRWVAPPKTSQQMAEWHGGFDGAFGPGASTGAVDDAYDLATRESGELAEQPPRTPKLETPYLPDPLSLGASLRTLPGSAAGSAFVQHWPRAGGASAPWHDRQPFRLEVVEGSGAPQWVESQRVLRVFLPQAEMVHVRLSSGLADSDLDLLGPWGLIGSSQLRPRARDGRCWMVSPSIVLTLVHAVEKPLLPPVIAVPQSGMHRLSGESFVSLTGTIDCSGPSTGRLDVDAAWSMQLDELSEAQPADGVDGRPLRSTFGHVGDFEIERTEDQARTGRTDAGGGGMPPRHLVRHELGDTRHRLVDYTAKATTRYREYLDPAIWEMHDDDDPAKPRVIEHVGPVATRHVPSSRRPDPPDVAYVVPTFRWEERVENLPGPVVLPRSGSRGRAASAKAAVRMSRTVVRTRHCGLRVWLRRPWYSSGDGELLGVVVRRQPWLTWPLDLQAGLEVPLEVRADADRVASAIVDRGLLTARGRATQSPTERLAARPGVVAELSAIGPTLGTLFPPVSVPAPAHLLTDWGADPAFLSENPAAGAYVHQFPLRTAVGQGIALEEVAGAEVTVVGHTPVFDPARGMWFCDIDIDAGASYTPFVRLALARYQPWSIAGHHLSRVAVQDFIQLLPRREARVSRSQPRIRVRLRGPLGTGWLGLSAAVPTPDAVLRSHRVTATVQRRAKGATDDLLWRDQFPAVALEPDLSDGLDAVEWEAWLDKASVPADEEWRILLREYELHETDPDDDPPFDDVEQQEVSILFSTITRTVRARLVYADALPY